MDDRLILVAMRVTASLAHGLGGAADATRRFSRDGWDVTIQA